MKQARLARYGSMEGNKITADATMEKNDNGLKLSPDRQVVINASEMIETLKKTKPIWRLGVSMPATHSI